MKRADALQTLSHQHHNSLMACLLLKKGIARKADLKILNDFLGKLFKEDIEPHFEAEEKHLFPLIVQLKPMYSTVLKTDHSLLRVLASRFIENNATWGYLLIYADLLENHIRFEERIVFNFVQDRLDQPTQADLEKKLSSLKVRKCTDYPVKFWE